jgi:hypothetical protein
MAMKRAMAMAMRVMGDEKGNGDSGKSNGNGVKGGANGDGDSNGNGNEASR